MPEANRYIQNMDLPNLWSMEKLHQIKLSKPFKLPDQTISGISAFKICMSKILILWMAAAGSYFQCSMIICIKITRSGAAAVMQPSLFASHYKLWCILPLILSLTLNIEHVTFTRAVDSTGYELWIMMHTTIGKMIMFNKVCCNFSLKHTSPPL